GHCLFSQGREVIRRLPSRSGRWRGFVNDWLIPAQVFCNDGRLAALDRLRVATFYCEEVGFIDIIGFGARVLDWWGVVRVNQGSKLLLRRVIGFWAHKQAKVQEFGPGPLDLPLEVF